jgi:tetratricopeptide (TPR) repeat protein
MKAYALRALAPYLLLCLSLIAATAAGGQEDQGAAADPFGEEARVLVQDVLVEVERTDTRLEGAADVPKDLEVKDLHLTLDGAELSILGLQPSATDPEPWHFLLYIDAFVAGDGEIRRAAELWFSQAEALTALGTVEIQVADPDPRIVLEATRDTAQLRETLSRWRLQGEGEQAFIALREAYLGRGSGVVEDEDERGPSLAADEALRVELRVAQERLDQLSLVLGQGTPGMSKKVLLWAGAGLDLDPAAFYGNQLPETLKAAAQEQAGNLSRLAAAYGWIVFPYAEAPPENRARMKPGVRLGKWRFSRFRNFPWLFGFHATYEEDRDPEKAAGYLEIGETLLEQGKPGEAEENLSQAIFHFYGDPRTADLQIRAYEAWARALDQLGEEQKARQAREAALELRSGGQTPEGSVAGEDSPAASLSEAGATDIDGRPLAALVAQATAGAVVGQSEDLQEAVASLGRRLRLTVQRPGPPDGSLQTLKVAADSSKVTLRSPAWVRSGSPTLLSEARLRGIFRGELNLGDEVLVEQWQAKLGPDDELVLHFAEGLGKEGVALRLSLGYGDEEGIFQVEHRPLSAAELAGPLRLPLASTRPVLAVVVLLEDLAQDRWSAVFLEL